MATHRPPLPQISISVYNQLRDLIVQRSGLLLVTQICHELSDVVLNRHNLLIDAITSDNADVVRYLAFERCCDPRRLMRNHCSAMSFLHELSDSSLVLRLLDAVLHEDPAWINGAIKTRASLSEEEGSFCVYTATYASFLDYWLSRDPSTRSDDNLVAALIARGSDVNRVSPSGVPPVFWDLLFDNGFSEPLPRARRDQEDYFQEFDPALPSRERFLHAGHRCSPLKALSLFCLARAVLRRAVGGANFKAKVARLPLPPRLQSALSVTVCTCAA